MNSTSNKYETVDYWYTYFGFPLYLEILYVYVLTPLSVISFALNTLSLLVLRKPKFLASKFFGYLKLYVLNSILLSMLLMSTFIGASNRFFNFTNSYQAFFYTSYIYIPVQSILYLYSSLLEICLVIERAVYFCRAVLKNLGIDLKNFFFGFFYSALCAAYLYFSYSNQLMTMLNWALTKYSAYTIMANLSFQRASWGESFLILFILCATC